MIRADAAGVGKLGDRVVNRLGFGSMRLTPRADTSVAIKVVRAAVELGVDHIDTAAFYVSPGGVLDVGEGAPRYATELIREALHPYPRELVLATKVGPWAETADDLRAHVHENLRRLGVERLDLVNLRLTRRGGSLAERFRVLADLRAEGLIRDLGLSNATLDQVDEASAIAPVVCVQNSYAVDLRRDDDLVPALAARGIAFVPFFAIAGPRREDGASDDHDEAVRRIARTHGVTPHQIRLAWTLHQGPNVLAVPGTGDPRHLRENIAAGAVRLTADELAAL
ncbi:aldo/keto reductase [Actinoplanes sp. NPDC048988]|uniref:aldo/keto reductase n=1 Tax=Actinoplanes sp. NPDC048988 TaxID=3363901 RepID=UPI00371A1CD7